MTSPGDYKWISETLNRPTISGPPTGLPALGRTADQFSADVCGNDAVCDENGQVNQRETLRLAPSACVRGSAGVPRGLGGWREGRGWFFFSQRVVEFVSASSLCFVGAFFVARTWFTERILI